MSKKQGKISRTRPIWLTLLGFLCLGLLVATLLKGKDIALLNPKGVIASEQHRTMLIVVIIMLELAIPTVALLYYFAWKYRENNTEKAESPEHRHKKSLVYIMWAIPSVWLLILASIMWPATQKLAPQKTIESDIKPLTINVVAMRWKWLFIYPEQNIASINVLQIPTEIPVQFNLTADEAPMSSFWIPHLAGQLYAMTGHVNRLNVLAETSGDYEGSSAEINGAGFAGMKFTTQARPVTDFNAWVETVKASGMSLDGETYKKLLEPSEYHKPEVYAQVQPGLYDAMLMKYSGSHNSHAGEE